MIKPLILFALLLTVVACKKDKLKEPEGETEPCQLLTYVTDTTGSGARIALFYNSQNLITGTTFAYTGYFGDTTKTRTTISYRDKQNPSAVSNSENRNIIKFEYDGNGVLTKKTWYENENIPRHALKFEWNVGKIRRIERYLFDQNGPANDPKSYTEKLNDIAELEIEPNGNLRILKRYTKEMKLIAVNVYEYDQSPNPFRKLYTIQTAYFDDYEYLISTNNIAKRTVNYPETGKTYESETKRAYDQKGYPRDGFYPTHRALDMIYRCR